MNIQDALNDKAFEGAQLLAGKQGVTREIKAFDVMEVPDIKDWLTEGVLLLTTFYSLKNQPDKQIEVFQALIDANAAGLLVKIGRYIDDLPQEIYELAKEHDMPVISVPVHTPYLSITKMLLGNPAIQYFSEEEDLFHVIYKLSKLLDTRIIVTNAMHEVVTTSSFPETDDVYFFKKKVFPKRVEQDEENYIISEKMSQSIGNLVFPLMDHSKVKGYIHIYCEQPAKIIADYKAFIEEAANLVLKTLNMYEVKMDWEGCLNSNELYRLLNSSGEKASRKNFIIFSIGMNFEDSSLYQNLQRKNVFLEHICILLDQQFPTAYKISEAGQFLVLVAEEEEIDLEAFTEQLRLLATQIESWFKKRPSFFLSQKYSGENNVQEAVEEILYLIDAKEAFQLIEEWMDHDTLGVHHYLYKLKQDDGILDFSRDLLQPLINYDKQNNYSLLDTLRIYLDYNGNQKKTAEALYIHRRTLTYRLKRITEIIHVDLQQADDRLMLSIAVRLV